MTDIPKGPPVDRASRNVPDGTSLWDWLFGSRETPDPHLFFCGRGRQDPGRYTTICGPIRKSREQER